MYIFMRDVAENMKQLRKIVQIVRHMWVLVAKDKSTNQTIRQLIPSAVSLRRAGVEQLYQVKRMIGGIGNMFVSVQCSEGQSDEISNKCEQTSITTL